MPKRWSIKQSVTLPDTEQLAAALGVSERIVEIMATRGMTTHEQMERFLLPGLKHLPQPDDIPGLKDAAQVLADGFKQGLSFAVWGDYDVDGVTSTAVVKYFLAMHGIAASHFLPNRLEHGYGLDIGGIEDLAQQGVQMLLTVDCGISDHDAVARARELGMVVVISDHHLPSETQPDAHAICNPRLGECACANLAGVGVAWMLMAQLNNLLPGPKADIRSLLDLVALGTVADVVKLTGANRVLVKNGLLLIKEASRPGIGALKEVAGYDRLAELGAGQIGFGLAPRINAAGRLGDPNLALDTLMAPDLNTARSLAKQLDTMNTDRRREEGEILDAAMEQAEEQLHQNPGLMGLVLFGKEWHPGIIGIVASRVVEKFYRPTLILCEEDAVVKGSGRSISEFDLYAGLSTCAHLLTKFGGHKQAAGLSLTPENLAPLAQAFHEAVVEQVGAEPFSATLKLECELPLSELDFKFLKELELLQPFGMGNPEPVFVTQEVKVRDYRIFGKNHVKLTLDDSEARAAIPGKAWRMSDVLKRNIVGQTMRFAFTPKIDTYGGHPSIELNIKDWQE